MRNQNAKKQLMVTLALLMLMYFLIQVLWFGSLLVLK